MKSYSAPVFCWLLKTPYRSLERAYKASKKIQYIKKDYISYKNRILSSRRSWQAIMLYINTNLNNCLFIIYWSLLEYRISLIFLKVIKNLILITSNFFNSFFYKISNYFLVFFEFIQQFVLFPQFAFFNFLKKKLNISFFLPKKFLEKIKHKFKKTRISYKKKIYFNFFFLSNHLIKNDLKEIREMNKKLAWIEASLNDLDTWKHSYSFFNFLKKKNLETLLSCIHFEKMNFTTTAYESIGLVPRSITRTLSRFQAELTGQSTSLILQDFQIARYQALASLQYMLFLLFFPWGLSIFFKFLFLEPWLKTWWNTYQFQIFINSFQEEIALKRLQQIEELVWLDKIMVNSL